MAGLAANQTAQAVGGALVLLVVGLGLGVWVAIGRRLTKGMPLVPYQPRRRVPWDWRDVLLVFGVYISLQTVVNGLAVMLLHLTPEKAPLPAACIHSGLPQARSEEIRLAHPLVKLLYERHDLATLLVALATGVVVAPMCEEFLFRLMLQGWLERVESRARRRLAALRAPARGMFPVVTSSALFAALHHRAAAAPLPTREMIYLLAANMLASVLTVIFGITWLGGCRGATATDLGYDRRTWRNDVLTGLLAFAALAIPIYLIQLGLSWLLPGTVPDPITMFFFASALGLLYYRTHRLAPSIALHMALNGTSLAVAWLAVGGG